MKANIRPYFVNLLKPLFFYFLSWISFAPSKALPAGGNLTVSDFGAQGDDGRDATPAVMAALQVAHATGAKKLTFDSKRYDFYADRAGEKYLFVSNNDEGLKRIAFDINALNDFEVDGRGAKFVFHDFIVPFVVDKSSRVVLRDFSVDFERPFQSEGRIVKVDPEGMELAFSEEFPYDVRNGILMFTDGSKDIHRNTTVTSGEVLFPYGSLLEFDPTKRETAFMATDYWTSGCLPAKKLLSGNVRLLYPGIKGTLGNVLVFNAARRDIPDIVISDSQDTVLTDISLYASGGMGVIAQRSHNITVERVRVTPSPAGGRVVSLTADATHFVNCSGVITMKNCLFENQVDDATNIHGIYMRVSKILNPKVLELQLVHPQQLGFDFIVPGMKLELVHSASLVTYADVEAAEVLRINKQFTRLTLAKQAPSGLVVGDVIASLSENHPDVVISGNTIRGNRARGILLGSRGKIVIEGNAFHTPGPAILLEGDGRFWFEQAGVCDLTIRGNAFEDCNYGVWGNGVIAVGAGIAQDQRVVSRYNRNILIEKNLIRRFDTSPIIDGYSIDSITFRDNTIKETTDYPSIRKPGPDFNITDSDNVNVPK